ncbi:MAG: NUDIX hydrolase [Candidatus Dormibacterales bacterium]
MRSTQQQTPAAVAVVVMFAGDGVPCVPIFQRTSDMSRHAGQMALPGGKLHGAEDAVTCAIRELREELGLEIPPDGVLGQLDDFDTRSGFTIRPVVLWAGAEHVVLVPSRFEVARLFVVPLTELKAAVGGAPPGESQQFSLHLREVEVFAPTAAILYQFSEVALGGRAVRVAGFYQPPWTHR